MIRIIGLLVCGITLLGGPPLGAATNLLAPPPIEFVRLDLADGRKLKNVVVKSYDPKTGRVLLLTQGNALSVPLEQIPAPARAAVTKAPTPGTSANVVAAAAIPPPTAPVPVTTIERPSLMSEASFRSSTGAPPGASNTGPATSPRPVVTFTMPPPPPRPAQSQAAAENQIPPRTRTRAVRSIQPPQPATPAAPVEDIGAHKTAALRRAENYFRYEHIAGSNNIRVLRIAFEVTDPEPVPGWGTRHRTEGKALLEYYDSAGGAMQRTTALFEVLTERKSGSAIEVVQFNRKS